ncbi:MAG: hypothetical protein KTR31_14620 [Myxococcales bacterium]|nr:hypothetical protein [Myxococcales bacterium]
MPRPHPIAVRLTHAWAEGRVKLGDLLSRAAGPDARSLASLWQLSSRERTFARELLRRCTRLWLWRTDPRARAGDFVVVDMSHPRPEGRRTWVIDLKCQAPLRLGGGGAGISLIRADAALEQLEDQGWLAAPRVVLATGDGQVLLELLGAR